LKLRIGCVDATKICRMLYDTSFRKHRVFDDLRDLRCGAGRTLVSINAYGDVYPCIQLPVLAGNVCYLSFKEIWQKAPFLKFVRKFPQPQKIDVCRRCEIRQYCLRCPGSVYMETDNFYAASPSVCKLAEIWKRLEARQKGLSTS
jgi:radical SAM protein with 4Fe4S-binding SPASM domain